MLNQYRGCVGVIISIYPDATLDFTAPIVDRLRRRDTVLRTSADASLLVQSLVDLSEYPPILNVL